MLTPRRPQRCVVLGATGFVGTTLVADLVATGHSVSVLTRQPDHRFPPGVTVTRGDAAHPGALATTVAGADVIFHLVHSLADPGFADRDRAIAHGVAKAAAEAGVRQIGYLGGPRPMTTSSPHLISRSEVADILLAGRVPALALQASMILGRGSAGLELLARTARLPVLPRPTWTSRRSRPVAFADIRHYLLAVVDAAPLRGRLDVTGPEEISYYDLVRRCARILRRPAALAVPAPIWSHTIAARLTALAAVVPASVAAPLFASLEHDLLPADTPAESILPPPPGGPVSLDNALRAALDTPAPVAPVGRAHVEVRTRRSEATPDKLWRAITDLGGSGGAFPPSAAWAARGLLDQLLGGAGLYRGRPGHAVAGDVVDFWVVRSRDDNRRELVLAAEMRLPGDAELTLRADTGETGSRLLQQVRFTPDGLLGDAYWHLQKPVHDLVFGWLSRAVVRDAERA